MKEMILTAAKFVPEPEIEKALKGFSQMITQVAFTQKMAIQLEPDEDEITAELVYTESNEVVFCPVTKKYVDGKTIHSRELVDKGFSLNRFIENLPVKRLITAFGENNETKQMQELIAIFKETIDNAKIIYVDDAEQITEPGEPGEPGEPKQLTAGGPGEPNQ